MSKKAKHDFTRVPSTRVLARDTVWNLLGMGLPLVAGAVAFTVMLDETHGFGKQRVELIGIVWALIGFSSIFDMGLGRALTKRFADKLSQGASDELAGLFWTALSMIVGLGVLVGGGVLALLPLLVGGDLSADLEQQARWGFITVALAMPLVIVNVGLVGVLQACRQFALINLIRIPAGLSTFLGPLCVLPFTRNVWVVVLVLSLARVVQMAAYFAGCLRAEPALRARPMFVRAEVGKLLGFGGWMTVSYVSVAVMTHFNRFIIRSVRALGEGAYYLVPEEALVRLLIFPRAWIDVLFPAFVTSFNRDEEDTSRLFDRGATYITLSMVPFVIATVCGAGPVLRVWLGPDFETRTRWVVLLLASGMLVHGVARMVWYFLQAAGRPDKPAWAHLAQLPLFIGLVAFFTAKWGISGTAAAWAIRVLLDLAILCLLAIPYLERPAVLGKLAALVGTALVLVAAAGLPSSFTVRLLIGGPGLVVYLVGCWQFALTTNERAEAGRMLRKVLPI